MSKLISLDLFSKVKYDSHYSERWPEAGGIYITCNVGYTLWRTAEDYLAYAACLCHETHPSTSIKLEYSGYC